MWVWSPAPEATAGGATRAGREAHMTGGGTMFGEYAGGGDLVAKAVEAVALAWTMVRRHGLADAFVARVGASGVEGSAGGPVLHATRSLRRCSSGLRAWRLPAIASR